MLGKMALEHENNIQKLLKCYVNLGSMKPPNLNLIAPRKTNISSPSKFLIATFKW